MSFTSRAAVLDAPHRFALLDRVMDGTPAQHVALPERYVHPLPPHLPLAAATLIETMATVRHAQQRVGIAAGDTVVVLGQGATGLLHTKLAKLAGAHRVIGVSRSQWKLDLARRFGADHVLGGGEDTAAAVGRLTAGDGADVVIDTAGSSEL